jgi:hypothetical protein
MTAAATEVSFPMRLLGSVIFVKTRDLLQQDECGLAGQLRALSGIDLEEDVSRERGAPITPTNLPGFYPAVYPKRSGHALDCLSRTCHLREQAGTLEAHFPIIRCKRRAETSPTFVSARSCWLLL